MVHAMALVKFDICIDVDDVGKAVEFYREALGLSVLKVEPDWAQIKTGEQTFWIMKAPSGLKGSILRDYRRHWTPIHLDFVVADIEQAVKRVIQAGGRLEGEIRRSASGALANVSDPAGNGVDLVQRT
jgi:predicted enzyme related to lactoylglutathione lyase